ncbi:hypothetical protein [Streptomyces thioluteus]|uniref:hypothetical protein n=1 Tax=Streptomyces thioluteus TaxID=66431 RepID=UPI003CD094FD
MAFPVLLRRVLRRAGGRRRRRAEGAGAGRVLLAGRRGEQPPSDVDEFVHAGGDAIAVLTSVLDHLGVAR